jgi:hypothetical protein
MQQQTRKLDARAVEIRGDLFARMLRNGRSPEQIEAWMSDPVKRGVVNALCQRVADGTPFGKR